MAERFTEQIWDAQHRRPFVRRIAAGSLWEERLNRAELDSRHELQFWEMAWKLERWPM